MKKEFKPIINSDLVGTYISIELPGFPGSHPKPEPCSVHCLSMGSGEPLLLVHSVGQSIYTWRELMPILAESYCVFAIDLPGFGYSDRPLSLNYSMDAMADVLVKCLDALGVKKAHAIGATMGAVYTMYAAVKYPDRFMKVVALTPGGITEQMPKKVKRLEKPLGAFYREMFGKKDYKKWMPSFYYDVTVCTDEVIDQTYKTCDDHASRQAIMYAIKNFDEEYALDAIRKAKREFFIIWGEEDKMNPMDRLFELRKILPECVYHSIRNTGHWLQEEKAGAIAEAADRYFRYTGEEK